MKKILLVVIILAVFSGISLIFAQSDSSSLKDENVTIESVASPRFPNGHKPKVAQKVGEGVVSKEQSEIDSYDNLNDKDESIRSSFRNGLRRNFPMEENPFEKYNKAVGVFAYAYPGLSWQHWLGKFGYQINFSGMYLPDEYIDYIDGGESVTYDYVSSFYMLTAEAQFEFFTTRFLKNWYGRLYGVLLGGFYYQTDYNVPEIFNGIAGFGIGFETIYYKHFSFPLHFGYYAEFPNDFKMDFIFGIGLRFRF